ncbi:hypothetical protein PUN28_017079 [Cardiocondyla obscurior]|uniref:Uncharacterized protein n=1 Tax=Cardiocondyla obscurior TaxID=286306 RepID=A0AAW2EK66_9HYME
MQSGKGGTDGRGEERGEKAATTGCARRTSIFSLLRTPRLVYLSSARRRDDGNTPLLRHASLRGFLINYYELVSRNVNAARSMTKCLGS